MASFTSLPIHVVRCAVAFFLFDVVCGAVFAQEVVSARVRRSEIAGGPYCGVYCAYAALRTLGLPVDFEQLLQPEFVGSYQGSTLGELRAAILHFGADAKPMYGMTASFLRSSTHPVILHVRRPGKGMPFQHWVLFLGVE